MAGSSNQSASSAAIALVTSKKFCPTNQNGESLLLMEGLSEEESVRGRVVLERRDSGSDRKHWLRIMQKLVGSRPARLIISAASAKTALVSDLLREYKKAPL
jgi:hypothetical protein